MSDVLESTMPGWRPDPSGRFEWRYFDGGWTNRVANSTPAEPGTPAQPPTSDAASAEPPTHQGEAAVEMTDAAFAFGPLPDPSPSTPEVATVPPARAAAPEPVSDSTLASPPPVPAPAPAAAAAPAPRAAAAAPAVAPRPMVAAAPESEVTGPFAALRVPRGEAPTEPAPPPAPLAATAPPVPMVATTPIRHDGSSGTVWDAPYVPPGTPVQPASDERNLAAKSVGGIMGFIRSFWEQEESYHSPNAGVALPPHPKHDQLAPPPNYARAGLVMLAALGVAVGAYLPWISGTFGVSPFERTGYQLGHAWGFTWVAAAFAISAMLATKRRAMGWVTMGLAVVVAGLVARQLLLVHDQVGDLNSGPTINVNVGVGLWIMLASAAIGLVAAFRFDGTQSTI